MAIAKLHSINIHMYADDIQCYLGFPWDMSLCAINEKIGAFVSDLNKWMNCNHLKLNQSKTNFIEFSSSRSVDNCIISRITLIACTSDVLVPSTTVKNFGVIFDGNLLFDKHVNKIVPVCCNNIRNLGRIGSKLSIPLKTQLVHSMILSHLDYCNAILYNLPAFLVRKLTKVLYAAVRFIFNMRVSRNRCHMLPYLKKLHFLPIKYRINFKIAMLTFKCLHGSSPQYLRDLVSRKLPSDKYNLRDNEDVFLLENMCKCRKVKSECMFSYSSFQVWNALPLCIREIDNLQTFKCKLKCHYFELAFFDVPDV